MMDDICGIPYRENPTFLAECLRKLADQVEAGETTVTSIEMRPSHATTEGLFLGEVVIHCGEPGENARPKKRGRK